MNISEYLISRGYETTSFNTNNDWGFGGGIGTSYRKNNVEVRIGRAYYRHLASVQYTTVSIDGMRVYDKKGTISVENFNKLMGHA